VLPPVVGQVRPEAHDEQEALAPVTAMTKSKMVLNITNKKSFKWLHCSKVCFVDPCSNKKCETSETENLENLENLPLQRKPIDSRAPVISA
jgi:hypothetical protein